MSSETFFKGKIYFQTSFKIPDEITFEILYLSLLGAASTNFRVLYYTMNKDHTGYEENTRLPLFYEDISGDSLESVHQQVIANINEDNLYLFQFYKATLTNGERYLVINAHHGIADGQMITNLMLYLYDAVFGTNYNDKLIRDFVPYDALMDLKNITFPSTWTVQKDMIREKPQFTSEDSDVDICIKKKEPETVSSESSYTINLQKTIPADVMTRCFSLLKQYDSSLPSYKHGLLLYLGMKALYGLQYKEKSEMKPEDRIGLSSVVNMRRYLNENATSIRNESFFDILYRSFIMYWFSSLWFVHSRFVWENNLSRELAKDVQQEISWRNSIVFYFERKPEEYKKWL